jgi:hypothetical protein
MPVLYSNQMSGRPCNVPKRKVFHLASAAGALVAVVTTLPTLTQ